MSTLRPGSLALALGLLGCTSGVSGEPCFPTTLETSTCDPATATFTLDSQNPWYPLIPGSETILEGDDDGEHVRIERRVLAETEVVMGVTTHILEHREYVDGEIEEVARNFYVEATDGTVCYFGEDVDNYRNGMVHDHHSAWRAGVDGAVPGIIMPADPQVGDAYYQEQGPGAQDMGRIVEVGATREINGTTYDDVLVVHDANPLESGGCRDEEPKLYVAGIGEVADVDVVLVSHTPGEQDQGQNTP